MATKLEIFNGALGEITQEEVDDTGEDIEAGRRLVAAWDRVVADCLSAASWNFAMETVQIDADTGVTPSFGFTKVFAKPSDWMRTYAVSMDEYFTYPLTQYYDDDSYWSADASPIYVRYVSDDTGLGMDLNRWTPLFTRYVELELAHRVCLRINYDKSLKAQIGKDRDQAMKAAKNQDAMDDAQPKFPPPSGWTLARRGGSGGFRDRGSRGSLIG
jgi:hypothetical protein